MSIYSSLLPEAHLNHNVFDPSARDVFSIKNGALTPFYFKGTVPNSVYDLQVLDKIELNGMPRANFGRMTQQIDFFFVPYSQLWKPFDNAYYQRLDNVRNPTNTLNPLLPDAVPTFDLRDLIDKLIATYVYSCLVDDVVSLLGRGAQYSDPTNKTIGDAFDSEILSRPDFYFQDVHGRLCIEDILRNLDLMGYGNFLPVFKLIYKAVVIMYAGPVLPQNMIWDPDYIKREFSKVQSTYDGMIRTMQFGSSSPNTSLYDWPTEVCGGFALDTDIPWELLWTETEYHPNAWPILAYLKIYNDYYKSFQYDNQNYAYYYNYDWLSNPSVNNEIPTDRIIECLKPRYHLYKRDMFTGGYPNSQFGNVAVVFTDTDFHKLISNSGSSIAVSIADRQVYNAPAGGEFPVQSAHGASTKITSGDKYRFDPALAVSVLAMRQAEAMQKWKEKNLRAGDRLKNQQTAFFGDRSRYIEDDYCKDIGSTYTPIMIDDVTATSDGVGSDSIKVGEKGSAGSSSHSNNVVNNFQCHDFGVIVGIMYILPESEYEAFGFDPMNIKVKPTDYFMADFQNLGLAPVPSILFDHGASDRVINYLSRYYEYKTRISKVHGEFTSDGAFGDYVTPRNAKDLKELTLSGLQVAPFDIDNLFYQASNMYQSSDQFKVNMNVISKDILPMSVTGLPY